MIWASKQNSGNLGYQFVLVWPGGYYIIFIFFSLANPEHEAVVLWLPSLPG